DRDRQADGHRPAAGEGRGPHRGGRRAAGDVRPRLHRPRLLHGEGRGALRRPVVGPDRARRPAALGVPRRRVCRLRSRGEAAVSTLFSYLVLGGIRGLIYGILALGLVLTYKGTRVLNLAQPFFGLLGAFVCWWLTAEARFMPFGTGTRPRMLVALVVTLAVVGAQAMGLERFFFRRLRNAPRLVTLVATLAIGQGILGLVFVLFQHNHSQAEQLRVIPSVVHGVIALGHVNLTGGDLQILAIVPLVAFELALFFRLSRFGIAIRAAAENSSSARLLGISVDRVASFSWVTGLVLAALAGVLLASSQGTLAI